MLTPPMKEKSVSSAKEVNDVMELDTTCPPWSGLGCVAGADLHGDRLQWKFCENYGGELINMVVVE